MEVARWQRNVKGRTICGLLLQLLHFRLCDYHVIGYGMSEHVFTHQIVSADSREEGTKENGKGVSSSIFPRHLLS